jgi:hypothetical protein
MFNIRLGRLKEISSFPSPLNGDMFLEIMEQCVVNYFDLLLVVAVCEASRAEDASKPHQSRLEQEHYQYYY